MKLAHDEHWKPKSSYDNPGTRAGVKARLAVKNPLLFLAATALKDKTSSVSYAGMSAELQKIALVSTQPQQSQQQQQQQPQGMSLGKKLMVGAGIGALGLGAAGAIAGHRMVRPGTAMNTDIANRLRQTSGTSPISRAVTEDTIKVLPRIGATTIGVSGAALGGAAGLAGAGALPMATRPGQPQQPVQR